MVAWFGFGPYFYVRWVNGPAQSRPKRHRGFFFLENVHFITLIYGRDLSFNLQLQNQVLDTHELSNRSDLHTSTVC
jgi:hypothetical protein